MSETIVDRIKGIAVPNRAIVGRKTTQKAKFALEQTMKAQRESRGIALLFL